MNIPNCFIAYRFLLFFIIISNYGCSTLEGDVTFLSKHDWDIDASAQKININVKEKDWDIWAVELDSNFVRVSFFNNDSLQISELGLNIEYQQKSKAQDYREVILIEGSYFNVTRTDEYNIEIDIRQNQSVNNRLLKIILLNKDRTGTIFIKQGTF